MRCQVFEGSHPSSYRFYTTSAFQLDIAINCNNEVYWDKPFEDQFEQDPLVWDIAGDSAKKIIKKDYFKNDDSSNCPISIELWTVSPDAQNTATDVWV